MSTDPTPTLPPDFDKPVMLFLGHIKDEKAPERLKGKEVKVKIDRTNCHMEFLVDVPEDITPQEQGISELVPRGVH